MFPIDQPSESPAFHGFSQQPQAAMPGRLQASSDAQADDWPVQWFEILYQDWRIYFSQKNTVDVCLSIW